MCIYCLLAVAVAVGGLQAPCVPGVHRSGAYRRVLAAVDMRGSGGQASSSRAGDSEMVATAIEHSVHAWRWRDGTGRPLTWEELVFETKREEVTREEVQVHIGCDSAVSNQRVTFAIAVCVVSVGHAGRYFYARIEQSLNSVPVLQTRLLREVELALSAAQELTNHGVNIRDVHVDSNTDPTCASTAHTKLLTGYVAAMGFSFLVKPEAWANFVADRHSRGNVHHVRKTMLAINGQAAKRQPEGGRKKSTTSRRLARRSKRRVGARAG